MKDLLKQLEKECQHQINLASGRRLAKQIAEGLVSYQAVIQRATDVPREQILILEAAEEVASRQVDERYANPNDEYMFCLLLILKHLSRKGISDSNAFGIARDAADKMQNSFWSLTVRHNNLLENIYDMCEVSRTDAIDELYCTMPELLGARQFDQVNEILKKVDCTKLHNSILYCMVNMTAKYIDVLPYYRTFWQNVVDEFYRRRDLPSAYEDQARTPEQIERLFGKHKDGPPIESHRYDPVRDNAPRPKSHEEQWTDKIDAKMAWAKEIGDDDLYKMLDYYKSERARNQAPWDEYHKMRVRLGDKETERLAAEALRAMADKIEQPGMHFMISCELPKLPIFSGKDHVERYHSYISVSLVAGPLGG